MGGDLGVKECRRVTDTNMLLLLFSGSVMSDSL